MSRQIAAIDLGSNSFHLVVARLGEGRQVHILDRIKEPVRLASGLDSSGNITPEAADRALACLGRFAERLSGLSADSVRAVGTNTLRKAHNRLDFLELAQDALGYTIDIISGPEEARLIYAGVGRAFDAPGRRLVIDIGGGSTELILGDGAEPQKLVSLYMGCVSWSERFFPGGKITHKHLEKAINAARRELGSVMRDYRRAGWDHALGSSGTVKAIEAVLMHAGLTADGITPAGLAELADRLVDFGNSSQIVLPGLPEHRQPVLIGGLAILMAAFRSLRLRSLQWVNGALKEGLLIDMVGRITHDDTREATMGRLESRLEVDPVQAARVQASAVGFFDQVAKAWGLDAQHRSLLAWAGQLHEAGKFIGFSGYHKHGAYLLANADLPGFSRQEQGVLAATVLGHRGRLGRERIEALAPSASEIALRLAILLRMAALLHRTRSRRVPPAIDLKAGPKSLSLRYPAHWLTDRPLSRADLADLAHSLDGVGYTLTWK